MLNSMKAVGVDPALIYASNKTGLVVTDMNVNMMTDIDLAEWEDAIQEYHDRMSRGDDPLKEEFR